MARIVFVITAGTFFLFAIIQGASINYEIWKDNDFSHYYTSSTYLINGIDPYSIEDADSAQRALGFSPRHIIKKFSNPPALIALFVPFAFLPPAIAFLTWTILQLFCLVLVWVLLDRIMNLKISETDNRILFVGFLLSPVTFMHLRFSQTQLFVLAVLLLGFMAHRERKHFLGAFLVGLGSSIKLFTWPVLAYSLSRGGKKGLLGTVVGATVPTLLPALFGGIGVFRNYTFNALPYISSAASDFQSNISLFQALNSTVNRFGIGYELDRFTIEIISVLCELAIVAILWRRLIKEGHLEAFNDMKIFSLLLTISVLFAPTVWPHYLHLLLPAIWCFTFQCISTTRNVAIAFMLSVMVFTTTGVLPGVSDGYKLLLTWWGILPGVALLWILLRQSHDAKIIESKDSSSL